MFFRRHFYTLAVFTFGCSFEIYDHRDRINKAKILWQYKILERFALGRRRKYIHSFINSLVDQEYMRKYTFCTGIQLKSSKRCWQRDKSSDCYMQRRPRAKGKECACPSMCVCVCVQVLVFTLCKRIRWWAGKTHTHTQTDCDWTYTNMCAVQANRRARNLSTTASAGRLQMCSRWAGAAEYYWADRLRLPSN